MIDKDADELLAAFSEWEAAADALLSKRQLLEMLRGGPCRPGACAWKRKRWNA